MKDDKIRDKYEELSLGEDFVKLVKLNQILGKEKVKILDIY